MRTYIYRVYYEWHGPTVSDMFAEEKSPEDLRWAFERFPTELEHRLEDTGAIASTSHAPDKPNEVVLTVETSESEDDVQRALVRTLQDWRLFAEKIKPA